MDKDIMRSSIAFTFVGCECVVIGGEKQAGNYGSSLVGWRKWLYTDDNQREEDTPQRCCHRGDRISRQVIIEELI
jgi:hypothetical protein